MAYQLRDFLPEATPATLIEFALARINKGLTYGEDMFSSRELCDGDATHLIEAALELEAQMQPAEGDR